MPKLDRELTDIELRLIEQYHKRVKERAEAKYLVCGVTWCPDCAYGLPGLSWSCPVCGWEDASRKPTNWNKAVYEIVDVITDIIPYEKRQKAVTIIDKLDMLTQEEKICWFTGTPMGSFESRRIVSIPDKSYEERTPEEQEYGGNELTIIWTTPTNLVGFTAEQIASFSTTERRPKHFYLYTKDYRGEIDYDLGFRLMKLADNNIELLNQRRREKENAKV